MLSVTVVHPSASHRGWTRRVLGGVLALASATAAASPAVVEVQRRDTAVHVAASVVLKADLRSTWDTLVGYERLPEFVPDMRSSRVLERGRSEVLVEQVGRAGFGPFRQEFSLTLRVRELPMQSISAQSVAGDFVRFESRYVLRSGEGGVTQLDYSAVMEPKDGIPPLVGVPILRRAIRRQFEALQVEIERRAAQREAEPVRAPAAAASGG
jgi:ribosome-associated toxin RatA of RatAB toxin-antitoxin module